MMRTEGARSTWRNWSGAVEAHPTSIERPVSVEALQELVRSVAARKGVLRVAGRGHSFTPLVACDDVIVSLENFTGVDTVDRATHEVWIRAGTPLFEVSAALAKQGFALENLGDINVQALAGAVSTGTHGTGASLGVIASQAVALELVTASGEVRLLRRDSDGEVFRAAQVSLGALGVLTRLKLKVLPAYRLRCEKKSLDFEQCLLELEALRTSHRHFEFFWFPYSDRVLAKFLDLSEEPVITGGLTRWLDEVVFENGAFWLVNQLSKWIPPLAPTLCKFSGAVASGGAVRIESSERIFATPRLVRFQEMEYGLPVERGADCLREIRDWVRAKKVRVSFPVEFRFVRADDIWLSPAYQRDSCFVAVHMFQGMPYREYFDAIEAIFKNHQGRPHWGKMHTRGEEELAPLYPRFQDFQRLRSEWDPAGLFLSPYLKQLFASHGGRG